MKETIETREDVFRIMDAELSDAERNEVMECENISDLHFSAGMYIRNRFLYNEELADDVLDLFDDAEEKSDDGEMIRLRFGSPDIWWENIAAAYKEYLIKSQICKI